MPTLPQASLMMQNLYTCVLWVNDALEVCWVNAQSEQLFSASQSRIVGRSILDILKPLADLSTSITQEVEHNHENKTNEEGETTGTPCPLLHLEQQFAHAKTNGQPFIDYSKHIFGINHPLFVNYSVTPIQLEATSQLESTFFLIELWEKNRQTRLDKERQLQEQHDVARHMLRSVAHEVKNPLAGIRGAAQLLSKHTKKRQHSSTAQPSTPSLSPSSKLVQVDAKKITTYANIIIEETDRLTSLIGDLLGSNRLPDWQTVNIHEPIEHVLVLAHSQHPSICIERDYDLSLPELMADKNQMIQVFLNLVNNACDAMLENDTHKPTLTITTRVAFQHTIGTVRHQKVVKVCVHDNGGGIAPELIGRIFFPMVTGRAGGTGLGLSLVQDIVHRHHGAIEVESSQGDTEFCVYLPFEQDGSTAPVLPI